MQLNYIATEKIGNKMKGNINRVVQGAGTSCYIVEVWLLEKGEIDKN